MIEQNNNLLTISFPTSEAASQARRWMEMVVLPWLSMVNLPASAISGPPSDQLQEKEPTQAPTPVSLEPEPLYPKSRHVVLTPERQDQIFNQRASGQASHQRLLRAQTTLRDGVLPFSKPGQTPAPSGQPSPRQKAQQEGTFADGMPTLRPQAGPVVDLQGAKRKPPAPKPSSKGNQADPQVQSAPSLSQPPSKS